MSNLKDKFFVAAQDTWAGCKMAPARGIKAGVSAGILTTFSAINMASGNIALGLFCLILPALVVKRFHHDGQAARLKNNSPDPGANGPQ